MGRVIAGIDPGLSGAIAFVTDEPAGARVASVHDVPTLQVKAKRGGRDYDVPAMRGLVRDCADLVVIEHVSAMPKQGVVSVFRFGYGYGLWVALLVAAEIPFERVTPQRWKRELGLIGADKSGSLARARELFPDVELGRAKDHGRADALLLAEYGRRVIG